MDVNLLTLFVFEFMIRLTFGIAARGSSSRLSHMLLLVLVLPLISNLDQPVYTYPTISLFQSLQFCDSACNMLV